MCRSVPSKPSDIDAVEQYPSWALDGPEPVRADAPTGVGISFFTANGVYSDPCHWDVLGTGRADTGDVAVGPTVDDLVPPSGRTLSTRRRSRRR